MRYRVRLPERTIYSWVRGLRPDINGAAVESVNQV